MYFEDKNDSWIKELNIKFLDGQEVNFAFDMSRTGTFTITTPPPNPSDAVKLDCEKCDCCPLNSENFPNCPAAFSLDSTLNTMEDRQSYEIATASAFDTGDRQTVVKWQLQQIGTTFVQLAVFASKCPVGKELRPYLKDLRPFSTNAELSKHLILQILLKNKGNENLAKKELENVMLPLHEVFSKLSKRFQKIINNDALPNSIVRLDAFALGITLDLDEMIKNIANELGWN